MTAAASYGALGWALSLPFADARGQSAARQVLDSPDPSSLVGALYPIVMGHKGLRAALVHLEGAGADLRALCVPTAVVGATFPLNRRPLWPIPPEPQWSLAELAQTLAQHRRLLWQSTLDLARHLGPDRFVLLSGRAMEALYPAHDRRLGFDTDLWASGLADGLDALEVLIRDLGFTLEHARLENIRSEPRMVAAVSRQVDGFQVAVGILAGGYHLYLEPLGQCSIEVEWDSQTLRAPSPEDLLVMLAVSVRKRRCVQMANVVDATVILRGSRPLDLARVQRLGRASGVGAPLGLLLAHVEATWPGTVPSELRDFVKGVSRLHLALTSRALRAPQDDPVWLWEKAAFEVTALRRDTPPAGWGHIASMLARRGARRIVCWQNAILKRLGIAPLPRPSRIPNRLPLCGAASSEMTGSLPRCVGRRPDARWRDQARREVRDAADRLLALVPAESHRCRQLGAVP